MKRICQLFSLVSRRAVWICVSQFYELPWLSPHNSMNFHDCHHTILWTSMTVTTQFYELPWLSPHNSMNFHDCHHTILWTSMTVTTQFYELPWLSPHNSMNFHDCHHTILWTSMTVTTQFYELPWLSPHNSMNFHDSPHNSMNFHDCHHNMTSAHGGMQADRWTQAHTVFPDKQKAWQYFENSAKHGLQKPEQHCFWHRDQRKRTHSKYVRIMENRQTKYISMPETTPMSTSAAPKLQQCSQPATLTPPLSLAFTFWFQHLQVFHFSMNNIHPGWSLTLQPPTLTCSPCLCLQLCLAATSKTLPVCQRQYSCAFIWLVDTPNSHVQSCNTSIVSTPKWWLDVVK